MFKLVHFFFKESKGMHKIIQFISKKLYNKNMPLSMKVHVHWMNLMKNQIIQKFKSWNFEKKGFKAKDLFFKPFDIKKMLNGLKMSSFICRSHVQEIILPKNMFGCPLKLILGIFYISSIKPKYSFTIMYECEKSPLTHELLYIGLFNFSHLNLFHVNVICKR